jgi:hypothetical protein
MFSRSIKNLSLSNAIANAALTKIRGADYCDDSTFTATLRALLYNRLGEGDTLTLTYHSLEMSAPSAESGETAMAALDQRIKFKKDHSLSICSFPKNGEQLIACIRQNEKTKLAGYEYLEDISKFMGKYVATSAAPDQGIKRIAIYANPTIKSNIIFIAEMRVFHNHILQSMLPRFMPWYLPKGTLSEDEKSLLLSLVHNNELGTEEPNRGNTYEEIIERLALQFNLRDAGIKASLNGIENKFIDERIKGLDRQVADLEATINNKYQEISGLRTSLYDVQTSLYGLRVRKTGEDSNEIAEFFIRNKNLDICSVEGSKVQFYIRAYLTEFNPDTFKDIFRNDNSYFYDPFRNGGTAAMSKADFKTLMSALFGQEKMRIRVCSLFKLDFVGGMAPVTNWTYPPQFATYIPNPHLQGPGCLGGHRDAIDKMMGRRDYQGAIAVACASTANINFADTGIARDLCYSLTNQKCGKIIELPSGACVTPVEAVKWVKEQESTPEKETKPTKAAKKEEPKPVVA